VSNALKNEAMAGQHENPYSAPQTPASALQKSDPHGKSRIIIRSLILFFVVATVGAAADLGTKSAVFAWRGLPGDQPKWWLIEPYVGIQTSCNPGALFGMAKGQQKMFAAVSVLFLGGIVYWIVSSKAPINVGTLIALGAIAAGILGNLHDRLGLWHFDGLDPIFRYCVRDWILFQLNDDFVWPNFNLADSYLVCSAMYILAWNWLAPSPSEKTVQANAAA
jgi:signal peptidase II